MKKKTFCFLTSQLLLLFAVASVSSSPPQTQNRKHYVINLITEPTQASETPQDPEYGLGSGVIHIPKMGYFTITLEAGPTFAISDNDATDGYARVQMPPATYLAHFQGRGKPDGYCKVTYTYAYGGTTFTVERSKGKPEIAAIIPVNLIQAMLNFENHELYTLTITWYPQ